MFFFICTQSLVGLQSSPQRPRHPHPQFNQDGRRPEGHRPDGHRQDGQRRPPSRRPQHPQDPSFNNGGELGRLDHSENIDDFDPSNSDDFGVQGRQNVQTALEEVEEEPMEHRSDAHNEEDEEEEDLAPSPSASTESTSRTTARPVTTALPVSTSTAAPVEEKSTLFPPFNKRVRPQPPTPAQTENKAGSSKDGSASGQLRITSYKQRIEAMKERAKLREQQQQQAQSKKDSDPALELSDSPVASSSSTSTSTTTSRPSTTRPKIPPRMPVRKPLTSSAPTSTSSTTEAPLAEDKEDQDSNNFEQYKRRFKPKSTFSRRPVKKEDDPLPASVNAEEEEVAAAGKKNLFGKLPGSPFGRRRQQQQEEQKRLLDEDKPEEPSVPATPVRINKETSKRIRPGYGRSTTTVPPPTESSLDNEEEESGSVLAPPWSATSEPQAKPEGEKKSEVEGEEGAEEVPKIELVSITSVDHKAEDSIEEANDFPVQHEPFQPELAAEHLGVDMDAAVPQQEKPRHSFFTMATNDPILPIEELLNIRVRDNGKGM